jgi:hypothetical protein
MIPAMARRMLAWVLVIPLAAVGVLAAHQAAYAVTGAGPGAEHGYLEHAPQVAGLLASLALLGLALQERSLRPRSAWWVAPIAPLGFVCQEHLRGRRLRGARPPRERIPGHARAAPLAVAARTLRCVAPALDPARADAAGGGRRAARRPGASVSPAVVRHRRASP